MLGHCLGQKNVCSKETYEDIFLREKLAVEMVTGEELDFKMRKKY